MHAFVPSCCTQALLTDVSCPLGLSTVAPPIDHGPSVPTSVIPLPPGTHLLFAQTGKIEHLPLEGSTMKKTEAKALLHAPVSGGLLHLVTTSASKTWRNKQSIVRPGTGA